MMDMRGPYPSDRLSGCVAVVIGGGAPAGAMSVGQAAALAYAAAGATVAIVDASIDNARRTAEKLRDRLEEAMPEKAMPEKTMIVEADITDERAVEAAVASIVGRHGRIDILHNNVGVPMAGPFQGFTAADWQRGMALNCIGAALTIQAALPHLEESGGAIVNVSSIAGIRHTGIDYAIYNASKAALNQLTVAVALEYAGRGVRANAILPGLLDTEMGRRLASPGDLEARDRRSPTGAQGDVWDVAHAAVFLASQEARYINGHLLVIDGGLTGRC